MARIPGSLIIGFVLPLALLVLNLVFGYGGILATAVLIVWLGVSIVLMAPEEAPT